MIGGLGLSGFAVLIAVLLLAKGEVRRPGIVLAILAGSAIGIAATLFAVLFDLFDAAVDVFEQIGGAL